MTELSPLTKAVVEAAGGSEPGIYATIIATLTSLAFNADWEAEDPKFLVLGVAEELAGRRLGRPV